MILFTDTKYDGVREGMFSQVLLDLQLAKQIEALATAWTNSSCNLFALNLLRPSQIGVLPVGSHDL